jgi:hypothetical protein
MPDQFIEAVLSLCSLAFGGTCWNLLPFAHETTTIQRTSDTHKETHMNALIPAVSIPLAVHAMPVSVITKVGEGADS